MTDLLTPGQLRDLAAMIEKHDAQDWPVFFREEAARREAEQAPRMCDLLEPRQPCLRKPQCPAAVCLGHGPFEALSEREGPGSAAAPKRPEGSNADEWALFLDEWLPLADRRGLSYVAVQIAEAIEAALRARLAPTTRADDEALLSAAAHSVHPEDIRRAWSGIAQRLAELRARAEAAEGSRLAHMEIAQKAIDRAEAAELRVQQLEFNEAEMVPAHHAQNARKRADAAERALAECRAKTIDECANVAAEYSVSDGDGPSEIRESILALKTKEPRDA